ncbi:MULTISPECIES: hypothetical protein [Sphingomonas]|uniref:hypothetical protein n=1 Tax=Sphingomonas TaxID=13687 RepID=UPI000DEFAC87|nr:MULTISPECIES: hypothetical protein [Sphingomonas]
MKTLSALAVAAGLLSLAACNNTPQEKTADNIEANAEARADNLEDMADNATTENREDALNNKADMVRENGEERADRVRTSADLDGNSADDTISGNSTQKK